MGEPRGERQRFWNCGNKTLSAKREEDMGGGGIFLSVTTSGLV